MNAAKARFSRLLDDVRRGQTFFITRRGRRLAELRPVVHGKRRPVFGCDKERIVIADSFRPVDRRPRVDREDADRHG
ncbi:MAG: type II toxin-antitoxin system prevent-host-death family antitoxin [Deltaproteobacteria bacterium]|nr:type II toxin-antitoxin system prevent-host-death family antitoxin [Deltaproteobacteria bacterium]